MGKAQLVFREKVTLRSGLTRVGVIWEVPRSERYPDGIRYRLALIDHRDGKLLLLFDNHHPKGHHIHLTDETEIPYDFSTRKKLYQDYMRAVKTEERKYANKKD